MQISAVTKKLMQHKCSSCLFQLAIATPILTIGYKYMNDILLTVLFETVSYLYHLILSMDTDIIRGSGISEDEYTRASTFRI